MSILPKESLPTSASPNGARVDVPSADQLRKPNGVQEVLDHIGKEITRLRTAHREGQRIGVARACAVAIFLRKNHKAWSRFCADQFWQGCKKPPKPEKPEAALRFVLLRAIGARKKSDLKRASLYYRAVAPLIEKGVSPEHIPARVKKAGGFEKLARANVQKTAAAPEAERSRGLRFTVDLHDEVKEVLAELNLPRQATLSARFEEAAGGKIRLYIDVAILE